MRVRDISLEELGVSFVLALASTLVVLAPLYGVVFVAREIADLIGWLFPFPVVFALVFAAFWLFLATHPEEF